MIYIDEAGRGPIAWPVTVWAVVEKVEQKPWLEWFQSVAILWQKKKRGQDRAMIDSALYDIFPAYNKQFYTTCCDSKLLSELQRESMYEQLTMWANIYQENMVWWTEQWWKLFYTAFITPQDIDTHGMTWALRHAIMQIVEQVTTDWSDVVLVIDGPFDFGLRKEKWVTVVPVIDGDAHIPMISAASIFAKVERDSYMIDLAKKYPQYWFESHKWYGTKSHYQAIQTYWIIDWVHRETYVKNVTIL